MALIGETEACTQKTYREALLPVAGWVASFITIACALVLAVNPAPPMRWMFVAWSISNALWVWYGVGIRSWQVLSSQIVFVAIDVVGMAHYWFW